MTLFKFAFFRESFYSNRMPKRLLLFDLDWTLVYTGGAGVRALNHAFAKQFGIPHAMKTVSPDGKTDPAIVREMIRVHLKRDPHQGEIELVCRGYIERLRYEVETGEGYRIMPGIPALLEILVQNADILIGLGTGNLKAGAEIKLTRAKLTHYFQFGGYSDDSEDRPTVLATAVKRGVAAASHGFKPQDVLVIGDNKRDVEAGKAIGALTVAVATGPMSYEELSKTQPDFIFQDLSATGDVLKKLLS